MKYIILLLLFITINSYSQENFDDSNARKISILMDSLWINPTSFFNKNDPNWRMLCNDIKHVDLTKLNQITQAVFNNSNIENKSTSSIGLLGSLNKTSHEKKVKKFNKKMRGDFKNKKIYPHNKVVLVEGDSWFEYPLFLEEVTDNLVKQKNLAVYSMASGGDWAANMIAGGEYQTEYSIIKPDVFIISGGGNDMVENQRLMKLVTNKPISPNSPFLEDYREYVVLRQNHKAVPMCNALFCPIEYHSFADSMANYTSKINIENLDKIVNGRRYLNKNFYRWLVSFKLEYKILFESLYKLDSIHFEKLKIITQGYDYAIPNSNKKFGIRLFMENGKWLKTPLELMGIKDQYTQESILMALMFDFNEMLIELGKEYPNIYHVDVRGFTSYLEKHNHKTPGTYWFDELHPSNIVFKEIAKTYIAIINDKIPKHQRVISVIQFFEENNN